MQPMPQQPTGDRPTRHLPRWLTTSVPLWAAAMLGGCIDLPGPLPAFPEAADAAQDAAVDARSDTTAPPSSDDGVTDEELPDGGMERCNRLDDDHDGRIDEDLTGPVAEDRDDDDPTRCRPRIQRCIDGAIEVVVDRYEVEETACDGLDNDCDGVVDGGRSVPCVWCDGEDSTVPCNGCPDRTIVPPGFTCIPPGRFEMGSPPSQPGRADDEGPAHPVRFDQPFLIHRVELTQGRWSAILGDDAPDNPAWFSNRAVGGPCVEGAAGQCPVERVSWFDAVWFTNLISQADGLPRCYALANCEGTPFGACEREVPECIGDYACGRVEPVAGCNGYRLPTEAEWARAARAGSDLRFWAGDAADALASTDIFRGNSDGHPRPYVDGDRANALGLQDVHGNVSEWVFDGYAAYPDPPVERLDPRVLDGPARVSRGGAWDAAADACRSAARQAVDPRLRSSTRGLRLARSVAPAAYVVAPLDDGRDTP